MEDGGEGAVGSFCAFRVDGARWRVLGRVGALWGALTLAGTWPRWVGLVVRIIGPPCYWRWCAFGTLFAHRAGKMWVFGRESRGFFLFFGFGESRERRYRYQIWQFLVLSRFPRFFPGGVFISQSESSFLTI